MTQEEKERRREVVASAIASQRIEGLELDAESYADFQRFVIGEIGLDEVRRRIENRFKAR